MLISDLIIMLAMLGFLIGTSSYFTVKYTILKNRIELIKIELNTLKKYADNQNTHPILENRIKVIEAMLQFLEGK